MPTTKIRDAEELERFEYDAPFIDGTLVRDVDGIVWMAYGTEDGAYAVRAPNEDDPLPFADLPASHLVCAVESLPFPLTITTEEA